MPIAVPGHDFHGGIPRAYLLGMAIGRGAVLHRLALPRWPRRADHINASRPCKRPGLRILQRFPGARSEAHTSELQSLMRISYAVFCLKKKKHSDRMTMLSQ